MEDHRPLSLPQVRLLVLHKAQSGTIFNGERMDLSQLPKFENTRGRFIRVEDFAEFRGWIIGERDLRFVVQLQGEVDVQVGQELLAEVYLLDWALKVRSRVVQVTPRPGSEPATIIVMDALTLNAQHGGGRERFRVQGMKAVVSTKTARLAGECDVLDISLDGLGMMLPDEPRSGTMLKVQIGNAPDPFIFETEVRYAQRTDAGFRTGLLIRHQDRISERKWRKYLTDLNERTSVAA